MGRNDLLSLLEKAKVTDRLFIMDDDGEVYKAKASEYVDWASGVESRYQRNIANTMTMNRFDDVIQIRTTFTGIAVTYEGPGYPPLLYITSIESCCGWGGFTVHYNTREECLAGHGAITNAICQKARPTRTEVDTRVKNALFSMNFSRGIAPQNRLYEIVEIGEA